MYSSLSVEPKAEALTNWRYFMQEIDLRIGASFTRFQTLLLAKRFQMGFQEDEKVILSYGPCQVRAKDQTTQEIYEEGRTFKSVREQPRSSQWGP
jgi:DNA topoisomerase IA